MPAKEIPQTHVPECTVLIWRNLPGSGAAGHPGHAALLVRRTYNVGGWGMLETAVDVYEFFPQYDNTELRYFSFWPGGPGSTPLTKRNANYLSHHLDDVYREMSGTTRDRLIAGERVNEKTGVRTPFTARGNQIDVGMGCNFYGQWFDESVAIPCLSSANVFKLGLNHNKMVDFALDFKSSGQCYYKFITRTNNCAGVAVQTLVAGGSEGFCDIAGGAPSPTIYITPADALLYAQSLDRGIGSVNRMLAYLFDQIATKMVTSSTHQGRDRTDIYSYNDWKSDSSVAWKMRGAITGRVDDAIKEYHKHQWATNYPAKMKAFVTIIKNVYDHFQVSKSGKREQAFLTLAWQILNVADRLARDADAPWDGRSYYGKQAFVKKA